MQRYYKPIAVGIMCLIFTVLFLRNTRHDFPLIFQKDLLAHDESSNSVVAANITRKFFPPMIRTNPLVEQQGNWMEGPYWQHIPPMFAYVPYLFFKLDGQVTIEVKRLAYASLIWLAGIIFINLTYAYSKSLKAAIAALLAAIFWTSTPFTHELITGFAFGVSDIVLAFTTIFALDAVLWYLHKEKSGRLNYPWWKIGVMAIFVSLPIMAKSLLGAIPAAIFFVSILMDNKIFNKKTLSAVGFFIGALLLYYLPQYFASPDTFKSEILVSFFHASNYEAWGRPWHYYLTNYLPQRYLFGWTWTYFAGLVFSARYLYFAKLERIQKLLIGIPLLWFVWNLLAVSLIESKIPNFIYQSYLLSLFAIVYALTLFILNLIQDLHPGKIFKDLISRWMKFGLGLTLIISVFAIGYEVVRFAQQFKIQRVQAYNYQTEHEKFYQTAEELRSLGLNTQDIIIVRVSDSDCWLRYYPLFLTGTESKTLLEMYFGFDAAAIKQKYGRMFFVTNKTDIISQEDPKIIRLTNYGLYEFDLTKMTAGQINDSVANFLADHSTDIQQDIIRIKKDKTSCQWLVPDPILNAP